jgi:hypothetical protein
MIESFYTQDFTRIRPNKDSRGRIVTEDRLEFKGREESTNRMIPGNGEDRILKSMIFTSANNDIQVGDRIYKGTIDAGIGTGIDSLQYYPVLRVERMDGMIIHHLEIYLG